MKKLILFGVFLLMAGLVASIYAEVHDTNEWSYIREEFVTYTIRPYQTLGLFLVVVGIVLASMGIYLKERRSITNVKRTFCAIYHRIFCIITLMEMEE